MQCNVTGSKFCRACSKEKRVLEFHKKSEYPDGRYPRCIECVKNKIYLPKVKHIIEGKKECSQCKQWKCVSCFGIRNNRSSGLASSCKACIKLKPKVVNELLRRNSELNRNYGISTKDFNELLLNQNSLCAICGIAQEELKTKKKKFLCVDHCHKTDNIRGLLCDKCNRGIGLLGDNLENLISAVEYLKETQG